MKEIFPYYRIGHFINKPNINTEFEITKFEEMDEPDVEDFHKHSFYEVLWIELGKSKQVIDYKEYILKPGTLFFISPGQLHYFEEWKPVKGGSIMFTADFFLINQFNKDKLFELSFLDNLYSNPCITPTRQEYNEIKSIIDILYTEHHKKNRSETICQSLLQILLTQVQRSIETKNPVVNKKYIIQFKLFKSLLDEHFEKNYTAIKYAKLMNITQHHLNHIIKTVTGKTATEVIRERSVLEAKRLLTFTDLPISEIAAQLNYFDNSYFTKQFKIVTGVSPTEFKKVISEKYHIK